ncbi:hypothetical protein [Loktanella salsilacus]|uniref:hypothetical protein n=2 Tax=Loktanella salsilacus TaxID=195913 RepID=UPI003703715A
MDFIEGSPIALAMSKIDKSLIVALASKCELPIEMVEFERQLRLILVLYELKKPTEQYPQKKILRRQIEKVDRSAINFFSALSDLNPTSLLDMQDFLEEDEILELFNLNPDADFDEEPELNTIGIDSMKEHIIEIRRWCKAELGKIDGAPNNTDKPFGSNLEHLIIQLAHLFNQYNCRNPKSYCYYDAANDCYKGQFFDFTLAYLNECDSGCYVSEGALGKRIVRALSKDIQVTNLP